MFSVNLNAKGYIWIKCCRLQADGALRKQDSALTRFGDGALN